MVVFVFGLLVLLVKAGLVQTQLEVVDKGESCPTNLHWPDLLQNLDGDLKLRCHKILHKCKRFQSSLNVCAPGWAFTCPPKHFVSTIRKNIRRPKNDTHYQVKCCTNPALNGDMFLGENVTDLYAGQMFDAVNLNQNTGKQALYLANLSPTSAIDHHRIMIGRLACGQRRTSTQSSAQSTTLDKNTKDQIDKFKDNLGLEQSPNTYTPGAFCFPAEARVQTPQGTKTMYQLQKGDLASFEQIIRYANFVLTVNDINGKPHYEPVQFFLHRDPNISVNFVQIHLVNGNILELSALHLVPVIDCDHTNQYQSISIDFNQEMKFARDVQVNECLLVQDTINNDQLSLSQVQTIRAKQAQGVYSPHTANGLILVNEIVVSVYSQLNAQHLQNSYFRFFYSLAQSNSWLRWLFADETAVRSDWLRIIMAFTDLIFVTK